MHNNPYFNVFLDHIMNLYKMIETCLKDDNMHIFVMINALICINNYVITCINSMLSIFYINTSMLSLLMSHSLSLLAISTPPPHLLYL